MAAGWAVGMATWSTADGRGVVAGGISVSAASAAGAVRSSNPVCTTRHRAVVDHEPAAVLPGIRLESDGDFAAGMALPEVGERGGDLAQRVRPVDDGREPAGLDEVA